MNKKNDSTFQPTRRELLRRMAAGGLGAASLGSAWGSLLLGASQVRAQTAGDYRALVVVYLAGGNDSFNLIVPRDNAGYGEYRNARQNLAVSQAQLLSIDPVGGDGRQFGLHPSVAGLRNLFNGGRLAFVTNMGTLVRPVSRDAYKAKTVKLPPQLFSHNDQEAQWLRVKVDGAGGIGWGGALADRVAAYNPAGQPGSISLSGSNLWQVGVQTQPYHMGTSGPVALTGFWGTLGRNRQDVFNALLDQPHENAFVRQYADAQRDAIRLNTTISEALAGAPALQTAFPANNALASQLQMVARMVGLGPSLGTQRQIFFCRQGGYDTHADQLDNHPVLLGQLSAALTAFQSALDELGMGAQVTTATLSEFGRTLSSNGKGTDHGWGGNQIVMGGAVQGKRLYGTWPSLAIDGPDDTGKGRLIPTTAVDQFAATLARWMGVADADLPTLLPNLPNFATWDLGFMG